MSQTFEEIEPSEDDLAEIEQEAERHSVAVIFGLRAPFTERDTEWMDDSACQSRDPALFYPEKGGQGPWRAKQICKVCPVRQQCIDHVMATEYPSRRYGTWGGLTPNERERLGRG